MAELQSWLNEKLLALNLTETMDSPNGFTRLSFSREEANAHKEFVKIAKELGLTTYADEAGNQWAVWAASEESPTIGMGSHLDSVTSGGGYDGVAGILAAFAAIKLLKAASYSPSKNLAIICFISEESARFPVSTIGSKAIAGKLNKQELKTISDNEGITVKQAMEEYGINWARLECAKQPINRFESFVELHIEQGAQLQKHNAEIGVVRGIACPVRLKVITHGMANHTGTTPMQQRQDALVAIAPIINFVNKEALEINKQLARPLVATVSTVNVMPNAINVIPGKVELGIDIRSVDDQAKKDFACMIKEFCKNIELTRNLTIEVQTLVDNDSVILDSSVQEKLLQACDELKISTFVMDSGAGHDVMNMAAKWPSGLLFIPCKDGISHHPDEFASLADIEKGAKVLARFLQNEDKGAEYENCL